MKFGRIGSANSARPFSSRSTERPVLIAQIAPASCNSPINSIHCELNTGSVARETSVPSKSILSSRIGERIRNNLRIDFREAMRRLFQARKIRMKSAYELAMERLQKASPSLSLTDEQKKELAEIDSKYRAKIAEKELFLKEQIGKAQTKGKVDEIDSLEKQLASEVRRLQQECEAAKEKLRAKFGKSL